MLNNRDDDKFEGHEESEYHFSDEDVSYETETEPVKEAEGIKANALSGLKKSKRLWISLAVVFVLIFVVYKLIAPSSTPPALDIAKSQTVVPSVNQAAPAIPPPVASAPPAAVSAPPVSNVAPNAATSAPAQASVPSVPQQAAATSPSSGQALPSNATGVPPVIPVQTPTITSTANANGIQAPNMPYQAPNANTDQSANLAAERERLLVQFQAEYAQKVNEYSAQTKALQDQMQMLTSRVAGLEAQLNQFIQALVKHQRTENQLNEERAAAAPPPPAYQNVHPKIAFSVQAIIPGRAWLKSESGETITVAEGDVVKDLGRITKIDPYDGVVEINTGTKVISLSYGNAN